MFNLIKGGLNLIKDVATLAPIREETKSLYIARPESAAGQLVYLHPDKSIPRGAKITVRSDECALFFREGRFVAKLNPGTELLDTANLPFLGHFIVDKFTDANHFICELFFVSTNECILHAPAQQLGTYRDLNSANVVAVEGRLSYTVLVRDPLALVTGLGGQSGESGRTAQTILDGRVFNQLRRLVGHKCLREPILDIVSNSDAESISSQLFGSIEQEFVPLGLGLGRIFDLVLSLDDSSLQILREFGQEEAKLALQEKGSRIASREGFAEYNLIQGQRAALEGLGKGLESGKSPMIMATGGFGDLTRRGPTPGLGAQRRAAPPAAGGGVLGNQQMFVMLTDRGEEGPYSARQIALLVISKGLSLDSVMIRSTQDPPDMSFAANLDPSIVSEYQRRKPAT